MFNCSSFNALYVTVMGGGTITLPSILREGSSKTNKTNKQNKMKKDNKLEVEQTNKQINGKHDRLFD